MALVHAASDASTVIASAIALGGGGGGAIEGEASDRLLGTALELVRVPADVEQEAASASEATAIDRQRSAR